MPCVLDAQPQGHGRFRRLSPWAARASPPDFLRLHHPSNAPCQLGSSRSARSPCAKRLLWPRLTSARPSFRLARQRFQLPSLWSRTPRVLSLRADEQISRGKTRDLRPIYPSHLRPSVRMTSGFDLPSGLARRRTPRCASCSSGQGFASSFLPTSSRDSAVAVRLGVPVIKASRGLSPPSHFPVGFRLPVLAPMSAPAPCPAHSR